MTGTLGRLRRVGLVVLFLAVASVPAFGQNIPGSVEITGVAGGYFGGQIYQNLHTTVDAGSAVEYGARLGYNLTEGVGLEGSWTYSNPSLDATRILPDGLTGTIGTLKTNVYELDGLFSLGTDFASFYVVLGIGATSFEPQIIAVTAKTSTYLSGSAGIGGKMWLGKNFGLRAEGRWNWVSTGNTTNAGIWCDGSGVCYGYSTKIYGYPDVTGGVTLRF